MAIGRDRYVGLVILGLPCFGGNSLHSLLSVSEGDDTIERAAVALVRCMSPIYIRVENGRLPRNPACILL